MSEGRLKKSPESAFNGFTSTPVKSDRLKGDFYRPGVIDDGVLSDDEDTFSLLSPIYHDSFDSEEEPEPSPDQQTSPRPSSSGPSLSPERCELPKTPLNQTLQSATTVQNAPSLTPWEMWLVNKAKEDRLKSERKAEEERLLKEKQKEEEKEQQQKMAFVEEKIQEWLKIKREQEKHEQLMRKSREEEEIQRKQEIQREVHERAQLKYRDWLRRKNQEKADKEKKQREEAALKEEQEKARRERAEEMFKDWLSKPHVKSKTSPKSPCHPTSSHDKSYPSPSFYNPNPWRPIHVPPPEPTINKTTNKKPPKHRKGQQSFSSVSRLRNTVSAAEFLQRR